MADRLASICRQFIITVPTTAFHPLFLCVLHNTFAITEKITQCGKDRKANSNGINESNWMILQGFEAVTQPKVAVVYTNPITTMTVFLFVVYVNVTHSFPQSSRAVMCCLMSLKRSWVRWPTRTCCRSSSISFITCHSLWKRSPSFLWETQKKREWVTEKVCSPF